MLDDTLLCYSATGKLIKIGTTSSQKYATVIDRTWFLSQESNNEMLKRHSQNFVRHTTCRR